jgi:tetratricopeptide (TPR) repeat protein
MARLVVLRGEAVDRRIDLIQMPVRIGRGQKNDVVLDDPMKGISRDHAEIRVVDDQYVLVDLESENGIWVSGRRVPEVVLGPNVVASIGPFRLMIADDATQPVTIPAPASRPVAPPPAQRSKPQRPTATRSTTPATSSRKWVIAGIAAVVVAAAIATPFFMLRGPDSELAAVVPPPDVSGPIADAERQIGAGLCTEAVATLDLALQRYPNNPELINVRQRAEACAAAAPPPPPPIDVAAELQAVRDLIAVRDCATAISRIDVVIAADPQNADAQQLQKQAASACSPTPVATAAPSPRRDPLAVEMPAENGGLAPLPNELERDYQARVKAMRERYDEAVAIAAKGPSPRAIAAYDALLKATSPRYLDVAARLAEARAAWIATAKVRVNEAETLEAKDSWNEALTKLNEAKKIDPSVSIEEAVARIEKKKAARGEEECRQGRQSTNYGRHGEAAEHFRRVLELLPPSNPCYETAQRYVSSPPR